MKATEPHKEQNKPSETANYTSGISDTTVTLATAKACNVTQLALQNVWKRRQCSDHAFFPSGLSVEPHGR